ncbi:MAG: preprotein translocase subunit SecE [Turicibacter sp.]|nr:preprotein translocase subunit SecE [Turicibacter sp.]
MGKIKPFFAGVNAELKKIMWPSEKEIKASTIQVVVFVAILAVFFFLVDTVLHQVSNFIG